MSKRLFSILTALTGIFSVPLLYLSFNMAPKPPVDPAQLLIYARQYHNGLIYGGYLQAAMPFVIVLFALAIVHLAGATTSFAGWATVLGGISLVILALLEGSLFIFCAFTNSVNVALIGISLIQALQHFYMAASAALIIPLGIVIIQTRVLPLILGYIAIVTGVVSLILGFIYFSLPVVDGVVPALTIMQYISSTWYPVVAIVLLISNLRGAPKQTTEDHKDTFNAHVPSHATEPIVGAN
ncbi:hypothetical protein ccbrp13_57280 [Ktedonobacteria bacterium brp13]|nr:hypothetical protein ccbrp13_57280 [Ktedonobacteria bacterium brp13]